jgi:hypothetical protein
MKAKYTFTVLRYIHDPVAGETANVGVALYVPDTNFFDSICTHTYGRLSAYFAGFNGEHFRRMMKHIERRVEEVSRTLNQLAFESRPNDVMACVARVLPYDDSSLQFSTVIGSGTTSDPQRTLNDLYERYVERYSKRLEKPSRTDDDVLRVFKEPLVERQILPKLTSKKIIGKDDEYEFRYAWKNGVWNTCEAVSLDLTESGSIIEKANEWLGRAVNLRESAEDFKLYLLLGKPSNSKPLLDAFRRAERILDKMPVQHQLVPEDEAQTFAKTVEADIIEHETEDPR